MKLKRTEVKHKFPLSRGWELNGPRTTNGYPLDGYTHDLKVGDKVIVNYAKHKYRCNSFCLNKQFNIVEIKGFVYLDTYLYCKYQKRYGLNCSFFPVHLDLVHEEVNEHDSIQGCIGDCEACISSWGFCPGRDPGNRTR